MRGLSRLISGANNQSKSAMQEERGGPSRPTQSATEADPPENRAESPLSRGVGAPSTPLHRPVRSLAAATSCHTPKRTEDVRSGVLLRLHWGKRDARSDECAMMAATGHQPGSGRATRELGQRHLAFVAAPRLAGQLKGARRKGLEVERFHDHTSDTIP